MWADLPPVEVRWLGRIPYPEALEAQRTRREALVAGEAVPEVVWLMEHPPVLTSGLRPIPDLPDDAFWAARGVERVRTERGGLATYHGPGQLVGAVVLRLRPRGLGVRTLIEGMEQAMILWLADRGIDAGRRAGLPGVWVGRDKIGAVGIHVRRGVSLHGFALNVAPDLGPFGWFTPCGVTDGGTTSVEERLGAAPSTASIAADFGHHLLWTLYATTER